MPLTPFHPVLPWIPYVKWPHAFSFWAITIGAMVSDLEVVTGWALTGSLETGRGLMHSVIGVATFNAGITVLAVRLILPPVMHWIDRRWPGSGVLRFAGQDLRKDRLGYGVVYASAVLGGLTHILLDLPTHAYNPVWWPWQRGPLRLVPFAEEPWWQIVTGLPFFLAFLWMMYAYWRR